MDLTVVVGTFGSSHWADLALERAVPSAEALGVPVLHIHADTLHDARNAGLAKVDTEWVCHLDADDELERKFVDRMSAGDSDVRAPSVRYVHDKRMASPIMPKVAGHRHLCDGDCLPFGNWLVVGSVARTDLVRDVGGWRDFPFYEDWDLWLRCHLAGATFEAVPGAVYRAHVRKDSRNRAPSLDERNRVHRAIEAANGLVAA